MRTREICANKAKVMIITIAATNKKNLFSTIFAIAFSTIWIQELHL